MEEKKEKQIVNSQAEETAPEGTPKAAAPEEPAKEATPEESLKAALAKQAIEQSAKEYMDAGKLVPDQLVIDLPKERIAKRDCKSGFILDGFPRTIPQAEALDEIAKIDCALALEVPNEVIEKRMSLINILQSGIGSW